MSNRFVRLIVRKIMNFSVLKVLAWSVPLAVVGGSLVAIFVFGDKSVLALLITNVFTACGSFAMGTRFPVSQVADRAAKVDEGEESKDDQKLNC